MFTGIIEEKGKILNIQRNSTSHKISISASKIFDDLKLGDSVAVNGVCLTACEISSNVFVADVMNETVKRSSLGSLKVGSNVNLERAMLCNGRFGGHIVSGHIDATGNVKKITKDANAIWYEISCDSSVLKYIIEKGSVAIDGISLTVAKVSKTSFSVSIIPHTASQTILSEKKVGDIVNIENDIIGKYIEKFANEKKSSNITYDFLAKSGF